MPLRLLVATRNPHKLRELQEALPRLELEPLPDDIELPPEVGETFADNALSKARAAQRATGKAALADDSGIEAAALNGRPGVTSARYAGPAASDEQNLQQLLEEVAEAGDDRRVAYVCALAYVEETGQEHAFEARCEGTLATEPRGSGGFGYDPAFLPEATADGDARTMAELTPAEKHAISHRGKAARLLAAHLERARRTRRGAELSGRKARAAGISVASNALLVAAKIAAGALTGSIAIVSDAIHSSIDLMASVVALVSVRKADEPADADHPYGHEKVEHLSAAFEGILILLGAAVIVFEATRRLATGSDVEHLGVGIGVVAMSLLVNAIVSTYLGRRARALDSPALEGDAAHLRADVLTSAGVLVGLVLVEATGHSAFDSITALIVAVAIVVAGIRILRASSRALVDEALPTSELDLIEAAIAAARAPDVAGYHKLRARRAGSRRHVDLHVQFRAGTTLERAHEVAHQLTAAIEADLPAADVLIHVEPEAALLDPPPAPYRAG